MRDAQGTTLQQVASARPGQEALLPITLLERPHVARTRSSRLRHRHKRRLAIWAVANEYVRGINSMSNGSCRDITRPRKVASLSEEMRGLHGQEHRGALRERRDWQRRAGYLFRLASPRCWSFRV